MKRGTLVLKIGTLSAKIKRQTQHALACGALQPIPTDYELVEQDGINFLVRILANLVRKQEAQQPDSSQEANPFLPYEPDLFVADLSDTHLCLLNKYNVIDHHLLMVTREFEEQENWLNEQDFEAMAVVLAEIDGLAFYNAGETAGASQTHKHLQLVPLPLTAENRLPISEAIAAANFENEVGTTDSFPFVHAIAQLDPDWFESPSNAAETILEHYYNLLRTVDLLDNSPSSDKQSGAYNLLATREWMLLVPRQKECFETISVNSLGFAGALLVRDQEQLQILKEQKPLTILQNVAITSEDNSG